MELDPFDISIIVANQMVRALNFIMQFSALIGGGPEGSMHQMGATYVGWKPIDNSSQIIFEFMVSMTAEHVDKKTFRLAFTPHYNDIISSDKRSRYEQAFLQSIEQVKEQMRG